MMASMSKAIAYNKVSETLDLLLRSTELLEAVARELSGHAMWDDVYAVVAQVKAARTGAEVLREKLTDPPVKLYEQPVYHSAGKGRRQPGRKY